MPRSIASLMEQLIDAIEANGISAGVVSATSIIGDLTAKAASDLAVSTVAGKNMVLKMGDASAANKVSFTDSADAEVAKIDSDGKATFKSITADSLTATAATDLTLAGVATKDVISKLGDTAGARAFKVTDSADAVVHSVDSDGNVKLKGFTSTRNAADNSMYIPVATTSGYERGMKVAYAPVVNDGGYFESLYVNSKVASTSTPDGIIRAMEAKTTIEGNCGAAAEAHAILAKINASGASAEISKAIGIDVLLEEESSGTITNGIGIRVNGGTGVVNTGIQLDGVYDKAAVALPVVDGNAAINLAALESAFGTDHNKTAGAIIGIYQDNADADFLIVTHATTGKYCKIAMTEVTE